MAFAKLDAEIVKPVRVTIWLSHSPCAIELKTPADTAETLMVREGNCSAKPPCAGVTPLNAICCCSAVPVPPATRVLTVAVTVVGIVVHVV